MADLELQSAEQQKLIEHLKNMIREREESLQKKESELKESSARVAKLKLQTKAKDTKIRQLEGKGTSDSASTEKNDSEETSKLDRGQAKLLKKILEEKDKVIVEKDEVIIVRENQIEAKERVLAERETIMLDLSEQLKKKTEEMEVLQSYSSSHGESGIDEMYAQIVYKDKKLLELNNKILQQDRQVMDLQEYVSEKNEVIRGRDKVIEILQGSLKEKDLNVHDQFKLIAKLTAKVEHSEENISLLNEQLQKKEHDLKIETDRFSLKLYESQKYFEETLSEREADLKKLQENVLIKEKEVLTSQNDIREILNRHERDIQSITSKGTMNIEDTILKMMEQKIKDSNEVLEGKIKVLEIMRSEMTSKDEELVKNHEALRTLKYELQVTSEQFRLLQVNFVDMEAQWKDERSKLETKVKNLVEKHETELSEKDLQIQSLQISVTQYETVYAQASVQYSSLQERYQQTFNEVQKLKAGHQPSAETFHSSSASEMEELITTNELLKTEVAQKTEEIEILKKSASDTKSDKSETKMLKMKAQMTFKIKNLEKELEGLRQETKQERSLEVKMVEIKEQREGSEKDKESLYAENIAFEKENELQIKLHLEKQLQTSKQKIEYLEEALKTTATSFEETTRNLNETSLALSSLEHKVENLEQELAASHEKYQTELQDLRGRNEVFEGDVYFHRNKSEEKSCCITALESQINAKDNEFEKLQTQLSEKSDAFAELELYVKKIVRDLELVNEGQSMNGVEFEQKSQSLISQISDLESEVLEHQKTSTVLQDTILKLQSDLDISKSEYSCITNVLSEREDEIANLRSQLKELALSEKSVLDELESEKNFVRTVLSENTSLKSSIEKLEFDLGEIETLRDCLQTQSKEVSNELVVKEDTIASLRTEVNTVCLIRQELEHELQCLRVQIVQYQNDLEKKDSDFVSINEKYESANNELLSQNQKSELLTRSKNEVEHLQKTLSDKEQTLSELKMSMDSDTSVTKRLLEEKDKQIQKLESDTESLLHETHSLNQTVQTLESSLSCMKSDFNVKSDLCMVKDSQIQVLNAEIQDSISKILNLESTVQKSLSEKVTFEKQVVKLEQELAEHIDQETKQERSLEVKMVEIKEQREGSEKDKESLYAENIAFEKENELQIKLHLEKQLQTSKQKIEYLEEALKTTATSFEETTRNLNETSLALSSLEHKVENLEQELAASHEKYQTELQDLRGRNEVFEGDVYFHRNKSEEKSCCITALESQINAKDNEFEKLQTQLSEKSDAFAELELYVKKIVRDLELVNEGQSMNGVEFEQKSQSLISQISDLESEVLEHQKTSTVLQDTILKLQSDLDISKSEYSCITNVLSEREDEIANLRSQLKELALSEKSVLDELESEKNFVRTVLSENTSLKSSIEKLEFDLGEIETLRDCLQTQSKEVSNELVVKEDTIASLRTEVNTVCLIRQELEHELQCLRVQIVQYQNDLEKKDSDFVSINEKYESANNELLSQNQKSELLTRSKNEVEHLQKTLSDKEQTLSELKMSMDSDTSVTKRLLEEKDKQIQKLESDTESLLHETHSLNQTVQTLESSLSCMKSDFNVKSDLCMVKDSQIQVLNAEIQDSISKILNLESTVQKSLSEKVTFENQVVKLEQELAEHIDQVRQLTETNTLLLQQCESSKCYSIEVETKLNKVRIENVTLTDKLFAIETICSNQHEELGANQSILANLDYQLQLNAKEKNHFDQTLNSSAKEIQSLKEELLVKIEESDKLQINLETFRIDNSVLKNVCEKYEIDIGRLKEDNLCLENDLTVTNKRISVLNIECKQKHEHIFSLSSQLQCMTSSFDTLTSDSSSQIQVSHKKVHDLQSMLEEKTSKNLELTKQLFSLNEEYISMHGNLESTQNAMKELKALHGDDMCDDMKNMVASISAKENIIEDKEFYVQKLELETKALVDSAKSYESKFNQQEQELQKLQTQIESYNTEVQQLKSQVESKDLELQQQQNQIEQLQDDINASNHEVKELLQLKVDNSFNLLQISDLHRQLDIKEEALQKMEFEVKSKGECISKLEKRLYECEESIKKLEERNTSIQELLCDRNESIKQLESQAYSYEGTIKNLSESLSSKQSLFDNNQVEMEKMKTDLNNLNVLLQKKGALCQSILKAKETLHLKSEQENMCSDLQGRIFQREEEISDLNITLSTNFYQCTILSEEVMSTKLEKDSLASKLSSMVRNLKATSDKIEVLTAHIDEKEFKIGKLSSELEATINLKDNLSLELTIFKDALLKKDQEATDLANLVKRKDSEKIELEKIKKSQEGELELERQQILIVQEKANKLECSLSQNGEENKKLISSLKQTLNELETEKESLITKIGHLNTEIQEILVKFDRKEQTLKTSFNQLEQQLSHKNDECQQKEIMSSELKIQLKELTSKHKKELDNNLQLDEKVSVLTFKIVDFENERQSLVKEINNFLKAEVHLNGKIDVLMKDVERNAMEAENLQLYLKEKMTLLNKQQEVIGENNHQLIILSAEIDNLSKQLESVTSSSQASISCMSKQLKIQRKEATKTRAKLEDTEKLYEDLKLEHSLSSTESLKQLEDSGKRLRSKEEMLTTQDSEINQLQIEILNFKDSISKFSLENASVQEMNTTLNEDYKNLKKNTEIIIDDLQQETSNLKYMMESLQRTIDAKDFEIYDLTETMSTSQQTITDLEEQKDRSDQSQMELRNSFHKSEADIEELTLILAEKQKQCDELKTDLSRNQCALEKTISELLDSHNTLSVKNSHIDDKDTMINELKEELQSAKDTILSQITDSELMAKDFKILKESYNGLVEGKLGLENYVTNLELNLAASKEDLASTMTRLETLESKKASEESALNILVGETKVKMIEKENLTEELNKRIKKLDNDSNNERIKSDILSSECTELIQKNTQLTNYAFKMDLEKQKMNIELNHKKLKIYQTVDEVDKLKSSLHGLTEDLETKLYLLDQSHTQKQKLEIKLYEAQQDVNEMKAKQQQSVDSKLELDKQIEIQNSDIQDLKQCLSDTDKQLRKMQEEKLELSYNNEKLQNSISAHKEEFETMKSELHKASNNTQEFQNNLETAMYKFEMLSSENGEIKQNIEYIQNELSEKEKCVSMLSQELQVLKVERKQLQHNLTETKEITKEQMRSIENSVKEKAQIIETLESEKVSINKSLQEIQMDVNRLTAEASGYKSQIVALGDDKVQLSKQLVKLQEEVLGFELGLKDSKALCCELGKKQEQTLKTIKILTDSEHSMKLSLNEKQLYMVELEEKFAALEKYLVEVEQESQIHLCKKQQENEELLTSLSEEVSKTSQLQASSKILVKQTEEYQLQIKELYVQRQILEEELLVNEGKLSNFQTASLNLTRLLNLSNAKKLEKEDTILELTNELVLIEQTCEELNLELNTSREELSNILEERGRLQEVITIGQTVTNLESIRSLKAKFEEKCLNTQASLTEKENSLLNTSSQLLESESSLHKVLHERENENHEALDKFKLDHSLEMSVLNQNYEEKIVQNDILMSQIEKLTEDMASLRAKATVTFRFKNLYDQLFANFENLNLKLITYQESIEGLQHNLLTKGTEIEESQTLIMDLRSKLSMVDDEVGVMRSTNKELESQIQVLSEELNGNRLKEQSLCAAVSRLIKEHLIQKAVLMETERNYHDLNQNQTIIVNDHEDLNLKFNALKSDYDSLQNSNLNMNSSNSAQLDELMEKYETSQQFIKELESRVDHFQRNVSALTECKTNLEGHLKEMELEKDKFIVEMENAHKQIKKKDEVLNGVQDTNTKYEETISHLYQTVADKDSGIRFLRKSLKEKEDSVPNQDETSWDKESQSQDQLTTSISTDDYTSLLDRNKFLELQLSKYFRVQDQQLIKPAENEESSEEKISEGLQVESSELIQQDTCNFVQAEKSLKTKSETLSRKVTPLAEDLEMCQPDIELKGEQVSSMNESAVSMSDEVSKLKKILKKKEARIAALNKQMAESLSMKPPVSSSDKSAALNSNTQLLLDEANAKLFLEQERRDILEKQLNELTTERADIVVQLDQIPLLNSLIDEKNLAVSEFKKLNTQVCLQNKELMKRLNMEQKTAVTDLEFSRHLQIMLQSRNVKLCEQTDSIEAVEELHKKREYELLNTIQFKENEIDLLKHDAKKMTEAVIETETLMKTVQTEIHHYKQQISILQHEIISMGDTYAEQLNQVNGDIFEFMKRNIKTPRIVIGEELKQDIEIDPEMQDYFKLKQDLQHMGSDNQSLNEKVQKLEIQLQYEKDLAHSMATRYKEEVKEISELRSRVHKLKMEKCTSQHDDKEDDDGGSTISSNSSEQVENYERAEISRLTERLQQDDCELKSLSDQKKDLEMELDDLLDELHRKDDMLYQTKVELNSSLNFIDELESDLRDRDDEIRLIKDMLEKARIDVFHLRDELNYKDGIIGNLSPKTASSSRTQSFESLDEVTRCQKKLIKKESKILVLSKKIKELTEEKQQSAGYQDESGEIVNEQIASLLSEKVTLESCNKERESQIKDLEAQIASSESSETRDTKLRNLLKKKEAKILVLNKKLAELTECSPVNTSLHSDMSVSQESLDTHDSLRNMLTVDINQKDQHIQDLMKYIADLQTNLSYYKHVLVEKEEELDHAHSKLIDAERSQSTLTSDREKMQKILLQKEEELELLNQKWKNAKQNLEESYSEQDMNYNHCQLLESQKAELELQIAGMKKHHSEMSAYSEGLWNELGELKLNYETLLSEKEDLELQIQQFTKEKKEVEVKMVELQNEVQTIQTGKEKLDSDFVQMQEDFNREVKDGQTKESKIIKLTHINQEVVKEGAGLKQCISEKNTIIEQLIEKLNVEQEQINAEENLDKDVIKHLEEEIKKNLSKIEDLSETCQIQKANLEVTRQMLKEKNKLIEQLQETSFETESVADLQASLTMKESKISELFNDVEYLNKKLIVLNEAKDLLVDEDLTLKTENEELRQQPKRLLTDFTEMKQHHDDVQQQLDKVNAVLLERDWFIHDLQKQVQQTQQELAKKDESLAIMSQLKEGVESESITKDNELESLRSQNVVISDDYEKQQVALGHNLRSYTEAANSATEKLESFSDLQNQVDSSKSALSDKYIQISQSSSALQQKDLNSQQLRNTISEMNNQMQNYAESSSNLQCQLDFQDEKIQILTSQLQEAIDMKSEMEVKYTHVKAESEKLKSQTEIYMSQVENVEQELIQLSAINEEYVLKEKSLQESLQTSMTLEESLKSQLSAAKSDLETTNQMLELHKGNSSDQENKLIQFMEQNGVLEQKLAKVNQELQSNIEEHQLKEQNFIQSQQEASGEFEETKKRMVDVQDKLNLVNNLLEEEKCQSLDKEANWTEMADQFNQQLQSKADEMVNLRAELDKTQKAVEMSNDLLKEKDVKIKSLLYNFQEMEARLSPLTENMTQSEELKNAKEEIQEKQQALDDKSQQLRNTISEMNNQMQNYAETSSNLQCQLDFQDEKIQILTSQLQEAIDMKSEMEVKYTHVKAESEKLKSQTEIYMSQVENVKQELIQLSTINEEYVLKEKSLQESLQTSMTLEESLKSQLSAAKSDLETTNQMLELHKGNSSDQENKLIQFMEQNGVLEQKLAKVNQELQSNIEEHQLKEQNFIQSQQEASGEFEETKKRMVDVQDKLNLVNNLLEEEKCQSLDKEANWTEMADQFNQQLQSKADEMVKLRAELDKTQKAVEMSNDLLKEKDVKIKSLLSNFQEMEARLSPLTENMAQSEEFKNAKEEIQEKQQALDDKVLTLKKALATVKKLKFQLQKSDDKFKELESAREEEKKRKEEFHKELQEKTFEVQELKSSMQSLKTDIITADAKELEEIKAQMQSYVEYSQQLQEQVQQLTETLFKSEQLLKQKQTALDDLQEECSKLKTETVELNSSYDCLKQEINEDHNQTVLLKEKHILNLSKQIEDLDSGYLSLQQKLTEKDNNNSWLMIENTRLSTLERSVEDKLEELSKFHRILQDLELTSLDQLQEKLAFSNQEANVKETTVQTKDQLELMLDELQSQMIDKIDYKDKELALYVERLNSIKQKLVGKEENLHKVTKKDGSDERLMEAVQENQTLKDDLEQVKTKGFSQETEILRDELLNQQAQHVALQPMATDEEIHSRTLQQSLFEISAEHDSLKHKCEELKHANQALTEELQTQRAVQGTHKTLATESTSTSSKTWNEAKIAKEELMKENEFLKEELQKQQAEQLAIQPLVSDDEATDGNSLSKLVIEHESLKLKYEELESEKNLIQKLNGQLQEEKEAIKADFEMQIAVVENLQHLLKENQMTIDQLHSQDEDLNTKIQALKADKDELKDRIESLQGQCKGLEQIVASAQMSEMDLKHQLTELNNQLEKVKNEKTSIREEFHKLQESFFDKPQQVGFTGQVEESLVREVLHQTSAIAPSKADAEFPDITEKYGSLVEEHEKVNNKLHINEVKCEKMLFKLKAFKDKNDKLTAEVENLKKYKDQVDSGVPKDDKSVLETSLQQCKLDLKESNSSCYTFSEENNSLKHMVASFQEQIQTVQNELVTKVKEVEMMKSINNPGLISDLEQKLISLTTENQKLKEQNEVKDISIDEYKLADSNEDLSDLNENFSIESNSLKSKLASLQEQYNMLEADNQEFIILSDNLRETVQKLKKDNEEKFYLLSKKDEELSMEGNNSELSAQLRNIEGVRDELLEEMVRLKSELLQWKAKDENKTQIIQELERVVGADEDLKAKMIELESEREELVEEMEGLREDAIKAKREKMAVKDELNKYESQIDTLKTDNQGLNEQIDGLAWKLEEASGYEEELQDVRQQLDIELKKVVRHISCEEEKNVIVNKLDAIYIEAESLKSEVEKKKSEVDALKTQLQISNETLSELAKVEEDKWRLSKELTECKVTIEMQNRQLNELNIRLQSLDDLEVEFSDLNEQYNKALNDKNDMTRQIQELCDQLQKLNNVEKEISLTVEQKDHFAREKETLQQRVNDLESQGTNVTDENAKLKQELTMLKSSLQQVTFESNTLKSQLHVASSSDNHMSQFKSEYDNLQKQFNKAIEQKNKSIEDLNEAHLNHQRREQRCQQLAMQVSQLAEDRSYLNAQLSHLSKSLREKESDWSNMENQYRSLYQNHMTTQIKMADLEKRVISETFQKAHGSSTKSSVLGHVISDKSLEEDYKQKLKTSERLKEESVQTIKELQEKLDKEEKRSDEIQKMLNDTQDLLLLHATKPLPEVRLQLEEDDSDSRIREYNALLTRRGMGYCRRLQRWMKVKKQYFSFSSRQLTRIMKFRPNIRKCLWAYFIFIHVLVVVCFSGLL